MKMPDRPGGAGGSLIRANQFDAEDTPPFSRTRSGANTIHKRNGDLVVTRDTESTTEPPWLLIAYSYFASLAQPFEMLIHRLGFGNEDRIDQAAGSTVPGQVPAVDLAYVGDGWLLELYQITATRVLRLRLRAVDDLENPVDLGVTIQPFAEGIQFSLGVSLCALGWRDAENGYAFAATYFNVSTGKHVYVVGSTARRSIVMTADMPEPSGYPEGWWTPGTYIGQTPLSIDYGYPKAYAVGRGHILALMVPRDPIEYGIEGGIPQTAPRAGFMSPAGAPQLMHSRDFGESWTAEPAQYLTELGVFKASTNTDDPEAPTYDVPARYVPWLSNFYASPIGGGRIAIAAGGPSDSPAMEFELEPWVYSIEHQTLRFFISGAGGSGFSARPWPLDAARNNFPTPLGAAEASTDTIRRPLFGYNFTNQYVMGSLGPGTFFALVEQVSRTNPGYLYGAYPAAQPLLACVTRDSGNSWAIEQIPSTVVPFSKTFYENKAGWAGIDPINTGDGTLSADSWLYRWLGLCVTAESDSLGRGGDVAFVTSEIRGPLALAVSAGKSTFADMELFTVESETVWTPHPTRVQFIPRPIYTGDILSATHPETIRVGYPEFEDRT